MHGPAEVTQTKLPSLANENVLGLDVPVDDMASVHELHGRGHVSHVALRLGLSDTASSASQGFVQLAAAQEFEDQVDVLGIVKVAQEASNVAVL